MANYQSFQELADENDVVIQVLPENKGGPRLWHHYIHDLDYFFTKIYRYHQRSGFTCLVVSQILDLFQFAFVVIFTVFLYSYIDYPVLFRDKLPGNSNSTGGSGENGKVTIVDIVKSPSLVQFSTLEVLLIICAVCFWCIRLIKVIQSCFVYYTIRDFYIEALRINDCTQYTWQEVQNRLIQAQHFCSLQEGTLNELDVHNRILRHKNYMIALLNKNLLPVRFQIPLIGEAMYFSKGLEYNIELLLFKGPFSIFETSWKLKDEYKQLSHRLECAERFAKNCLILAWINFLLMPLILIWQILFIFYANAETLKRDPSHVFASKSWSFYARLFCRHFNELDHQLNERLNRGHKSATKYMNSFTSPLLEILAKNIMFISGSMLAVMLLLTIYDEDVIAVEHIITLMAVLGVVIAVARGFIGPDVPLKQTKAELHAQIVQHIHYLPHRYSPYSVQAQREMARLFQYKVQNILEGLLSPLVTPFIILLQMRSRSLEYVDFFRNHTVELTGTGDVCIFAMMNIRAHGNPVYVEDKVALKPAEAPGTREPLPETDVPSNLVTDNGKLELSLIHFKLTNPNWKPLQSQQKFIDFVTTSALNESMMEGDLNAGTSGGAISRSSGGSREMDELGDLVGSSSRSGRRHKTPEVAEIQPTQQPTSSSATTSQSTSMYRSGYAMRRLNLEESADLDDIDLKMSLSSQFLNKYASQVDDDGNPLTEGRQRSVQGGSSQHHEKEPLLSNPSSTGKRHY